MPFVITAAERASFRRCRRQWDFGSGHRQDLEPVARPGLPDLDRAVRDALAVYYFPGMWDWDRGVRLPLVAQELERALDRQRERSGGEAGDGPWQDAAARSRALLPAYFDWAPTVDRFAPVMVETDFEVTVLDPDRPDAALVTTAGEPIRYGGRIDLLAVDASDAYWIVRHRLVEGDWPPTERLATDEESLSACWAWEQFYLGMAITGTVYNELRRPRPSDTEPAAPGQHAGDRPRRAAWPWHLLRSRAPGAARPPVRQHEPSGGGRSIPQHRRMYARAKAANRVEPVEQRVDGGFRRTWLRRSPAEVAEAGRRLGADLADMARADVSVYPEPSDEICPVCPFLGPCQALMAGDDARPILLADYRARPPEVPEEGRLGGRAWSTGRGAAPPKFRRDPGS
jgi:hypothetical protein